MMWWRKKTVAASPPVHTPLNITSERKVFGVPIEKVPRLEGHNVPIFVEKAIAFLHKNTDVEGLFRVSGSNLQMMELTNRFNAGQDVDLSESDPHTIAGLLKKFFRELPEHIIPAILNGGASHLVELNNQQNQNGEKSTAIALFKSLLYTLPPINFATFKALIGLLRSLTNNSSTTKMTVQNIAICIVPSLGCVPAIVTYSLQNYDYFFNTPLENNEIESNENDENNDENNPESNENDENNSENNNENDTPINSNIAIFRTPSITDSESFSHSPFDRSNSTLTSSFPSTPPTLSNNISSNDIQESSKGISTLTLDKTKNPDNDVNISSVSSISISLATGYLSSGVSSASINTKAHDRLTEKEQPSNVVETSQKRLSTYEGVLNSSVVSLAYRDKIKDKDDSNDKNNVQRVRRESKSHRDRDKEREKGDKDREREREKERERDKNRDRESVYKSRDNKDKRVSELPRRAVSERDLEKERSKEREREREREERRNREIKDDREKERSHREREKDRDRDREKDRERDRRTKNKEDSGDDWDKNIAKQFEKDLKDLKKERERYGSKENHLKDTSEEDLSSSTHEKDKDKDTRDRKNSYRESRSHSYSHRDRDRERERERERDREKDKKREKKSDKDREKSFHKDNLSSISSGSDKKSDDRQSEYDRLLQKIERAREKLRKTISLTESFTEKGVQLEEQIQREEDKNKVLRAEAKNVERVLRKARRRNVKSAIIESPPSMVRTNSAHQLAEEGAPVSKTRYTILFRNSVLEDMPANSRMSLPPLTAR